MCHQRPLHVRCSFCDVFLNEQNPNEDPNDSTQGPLDRVQDGYTHFVRCTKAEKQLARWESVVSEVDAAIEFFKSIGTKAEDILVEFAWELKLKKRTEAKISHWKCPNGMTWDLEPIISLHYCGACFRETSAWDQWPSREAHVKWLESEANARGKMVGKGGPLMKIGRRELRTKAQAFVTKTLSRASQSGEYLKAKSGW